MEKIKLRLNIVFALILIALTLSVGALLLTNNVLAKESAANNSANGNIYNSAPASGTNRASCKFLYADNSPLANCKVEINGKTYTTDAQGSLTTDYLPYGNYTPTVSSIVDDGFDTTILNQKVRVSALSHIPAISDLNRISLYRKFVLSICTVNTKNLPVANMVVSVYKNNNLVIRSTVTTCKAGTINFNWQEMPGGSNSVPISIGDTLEIRAYDNDESGKFQEIAETVVIRKPLTYLQIVAYKPGEQKVTYAPQPYQVLTYKSGENNAAALVFDFPFVIAGKSNEVDAPISKELVTLTDASGNKIELLSAKIRYNQIIVTYDAKFTASKISYNGDSAKDGYIVSSKNPDVRVASTEQSIDFNSDDAEYLVQFEREVLRLVNELRVDVGINTLIDDSDLTRMARIKSNDMKFNGYIDHNSPGFDIYYKQLKQFGLNYSVSGENLALVPVSDGDAQLTPEQLAEAVYWGWKQSPGHYANMINKDFTRLGVGYAKDGYWTQIFGKKQGETIYKLTAKAQSYGGTVKVISTGLMGSDAAAIVTPNEGMQFAGWFNSSTGEKLSDEISYTFKVQGDISLLAKFDKANYKYEIKKVYIVKDSQGNYTIDKSGSDCEATGGGNYSYGQRITFNANPSSGYKFRGWNFHTYTPGEHPNKASAQMTVVAGENATVYAVFERISEVRVHATLGDAKYQLKLKSSPKMDALLSKDGLIYNKDLFVGFVVNIESYDKENYKFLYWRDVETKLIYDTTVTGDDRLIWFNSMDINIEPVFEERAYTVTASIDGKGVVIGSGSHASGKEFTLTASPDDGYAFVKWTDSGVSAEQASNPVRKFSGLTSNITVKAQFEQVDKKYTLTVESSVDEGVSVEGGGSYQEDTYAVLTASIKDNSHEFLYWEENGKVLSFNNMYLVKMTQDRTIKAVYKAISPKYRVNVVSDNGTVSMAHGSSTVSPSDMFYYGDEISLTATAKSDYAFIGWFIGGKEISANSTITVNAANQTVTARYAKKQAITVIFQDIDGKVLSIQSIEEGGAAIAPTGIRRDGYEFIGWDYTEEALSRITSNCVVTAQYLRKEIAAPQVSGGVVTQAKDVWYYGDFVTVKAETAQNQCKFAYWIDENGKIVSYNSDFSFILSGSTKLSAVYINSTQSVNESPLASLVEVANLNGGRYSFSARIELSSVKLIECGIVFYDGEGEFSLTTENTTVCISNAQSSTGQFLLTKGNLTSSSRARTYLIYSDNAGNIHTVYSEIVTLS